MSTGNGRKMDYKEYKVKTKTPEKGIQEVSMCVYSSPRVLGCQNSEMKENKNFYESPAVAELKKEVSDLTGRLYEARSSRDAALRKNVQMQEAHLTSLKQLQEVIDKLKGDNTVLQKERDVDTFAQIQYLQEEVEKLKCEKSDLRIKMEKSSKETAQKESSIADLRLKIKKLESYIRNLENQKDDLVDRTKEYAHKGHEYEMQKGALDVLQQQLNKCQAAWELSKDEISEQKIRIRELERSLALTEKELTTSKVDVRLLTKQNKELEDKLSKEAFVSNSTRDSIREAQRAKSAAERKTVELEVHLKQLTAKLDEAAESYAEKCKVVEKQGSELQKLHDDLTTTKKDLINCQVSLKENEKYKSDYTVLQNELKKKEEVLMEKENTIEKLQKGTKKLKEACVILENQLKDFEVLLAKQQQEVDVCTKEKDQALGRVASLQEDLRQTKIALNEMKSLKLYSERKLQDIESSAKNTEKDKSEEIQTLKSKITDLKRSNDLLTEKMSDLLDKLDELTASNNDLNNLSSTLTSTNKLLKEESTRNLTELIALKERNTQLQSALEEAVTKCENYKDRLESISEDLAIQEVDQAEKELRIRSTLNQHIKLIQHLKEQNEQLSAKKKKHFAGKFFARDHKDLHKEPSTPLSHLTKPIPSATPRRLVQEHQDVKYLEEEAAYLKDQLAKLQIQKDAPPFDIDRLEEEIGVCKDNGTQKTAIFCEEGNDRLEINHIKSISSSLFLLGCEQGLYSRKLGDDKPSSYVVAIEGPGAVYQIEFIPSLNYAILIEGKDRQLAFVHLSLLRTCAEAAACSKPKIKLQYIPDIKDCHNFYVHKTAEGTLFIVAALQKHLSILFWEKDSFVLARSLKTPNTVMCVLPTPNSVIFGCDKIFELDIKNFTMEEFVDESDESLVYAMLACRDSLQFPIAILDVSRSNMAPGATHFTTEYLLCFPDLAIFVDAYGRRTRPEDIMWSKAPKGFYYRHPNLFIVHFNSVEIIPLRPNSFTKTRVITSLDSIGTEAVEIPEPKFVSLPNAIYLGNGLNSSSLIMGSLIKSKYEVFEVEAAQSDS